MRLPIHENQPLKFRQQCPTASQVPIKGGGWVFKKRSLHQIAPLAHSDSSIISPIDKQDNLGGRRCGLRLLGASKTIDFKTEHHAASFLEDGA